MSKHSSPALTMRDALYEAPGPKMRAKIRIGTAISLVAVAALVVLVRPSIRAKPSTSAIAPAVSATLTVPSKPASKNFHVVRCVKKYQ